MRNPSVNVTADQLKHVFAKNCIIIGDDLWRSILVDLARNPCNWRTIQMKDKQIQRLTDQNLVYQVAKYLKFTADLKKIKMAQILPSSPNWWVIEKLTKIVLDLAELSQSESPIQSIVPHLFETILVRGIKSKDLPTKAMEYYENEVIKAQFDEYEHKEVALQLQRIYLQAVKSIDNKTLYDAGQDIVPFFRMTEDIVHYQADPADWIQAQFDSFAVFNSLPKPNTLYGEKAAERYISYKSRRQ